MKQTLLDRFRYWLCDKFGHAKSNNRTAKWMHNGQVHYDCNRCNRIVSRKQDES